MADLDCFFVEVERLHRPELLGRPVLVGKRPAERGVVAACSYEARALGFRTAMPMGHAYRHYEELTRKYRRRLDVVFLHDNLFGHYTVHSQRVRGVLEDHAPVCVAHSIDEFELDVTGCDDHLQRNFGGLQEYGDYVRKQVRATTGLPISLGIGPSRLVAKIASRFAKPNGVYVVTPEQTLEFLTPLAIDVVPGIGPATSERLRRLDIETVGQLLAKPMICVRRICGVGLARIVDILLHGDADYVAGRAVVLDSPSTWRAPLAHDSLTHFNPAIALGERSNGALPKSIGHEKTLRRDTWGRGLLERLLWRLVEDAGQRLRAVSLHARAVDVKVRYADFSTVHRTGLLREASDADTALYATALELMHHVLSSKPPPVRLVGVRLQKLQPGGRQGLIFETREDVRQRELFRTIDLLRHKYGRNALKLGRGIYEVE